MTNGERQLANQGEEEERPWGRLLYKYQIYSNIVVSAVIIHNFSYSPLLTAFYNPRSDDDE